MTFFPAPAAPSGPANDCSETPVRQERDTAALARAHLKAKTRAPSNRVNRRAAGRTFQIIDTAAILALAGFSAMMVSQGRLAATPLVDLLPLIALAAVALIALPLAGVYRIEPRRPLALQILRAVSATGLAGIAGVATALATSPASADLHALIAVVLTVALFALQMIYAGIVNHWARAGRLARNVILVGATHNARHLIAANSGSGYVNVVGVFDDRQTRSPSLLAGAPYLGTTDDLFNWPLLHEVDRIILTVSAKAEERVQHLLEKLRALPQPVILLLDINGFSPVETSLDDLVGVHAARMSGSEEQLGRQISKRVQDVVFGSILTLAALPFMAVIAVAVKLTSPGPALFRQTREGFHGRPITVFKFRTMRHDPQADSKGVRQVELNDPRVTSIGGFLRKTSLDELPQLFNVLIGTMSLVGPRPHAPGMRTGGTETSKLVAEYAHRYRVKPGITGWAQINGSRGPLHSPEAARERVRLDVEYISRAGFWLDMWIMLRTVPALLGDKINLR
ncbi:exopolysaccharide biosynthesis polyprenyl glycosylphosphotransferase [Maricaulis sp.]|uniref:exopolysaccharide biosynthesis polyprenyl glycosylphosphotransferase n=1 Tax=Maricaulis sp. TaxID=1486257 RepID=UPI0026066AE2|nr:exopolysaccharide biosynthesis polyprenyl glycosylphosphotransferase [Maricaulis sp.]